MVRELEWPKSREISSVNTVVSTSTHLLSLRISSPKSPRAHLGLLCKGFRNVILKERRWVNILNWHLLFSAFSGIPKSLHRIHIVSCSQPAFHCSKSRNVRTYGYATKWRQCGMFIRCESNFALPQTLYTLECHQCWIPRGSDTSACPRV